MDMLKNRWIEIQFSVLCYDIYDIIRNYQILASYVELLADLAKVERRDALKALQAVTQINSIRPTKVEFIILGRKMNLPINRICDILHISKTTYAKLCKIPGEIIPRPQCNEQLINTMQKLLNAHAIIKGAGV